MTWKIGPFSLSSGSVVRQADDSREGVSLDLLLTAADRRALAELSEFAGRIQTYDPPLRPRLIVDASPHGQNLVAFVPKDAAASLVDAGFFLIDSMEDSVQGAGTRAPADLVLRRVAGRDDAEGLTDAEIEHISTDWT